MFEFAVDSVVCGGRAWCIGRQARRADVQGRAAETLRAAVCAAMSGGTRAFLLTAALLTLLYSGTPTATPY